jgi:regulator of cell morphogenesis and NO signaling
MKSLNDKPIGLIVAENLAAASVFEAHGMDFCCHGGQTLEAACAARHIPIEQLETELATLNREPTAECPDVNVMSLTKLTRHIVAVHHVYTKKTLLEIAGHLDTVIRVHGGNHPQLVAIRQLFTALRQELEPHLEKEERILFPYIEVMDESGSLPPADFSGVSQPIATLEREHESAGKAFDRINALADGYHPPDDACNTYRLVLRELQELEQDLHIHIATENYLLFPKAVALEKSLGGQKQ